MQTPYIFAYSSFFTYSDMPGVDGCFNSHTNTLLLTEFVFLFPKRCTRLRHESEQNATAKDELTFIYAIYVHHDKWDCVYLKYTKIREPPTRNLKPVFGDAQAGGVR